MAKARFGAANPQWRGVKDEILRLARAGYRRKEISEMLDCSYRYTGRVLRNAGIHLGRPTGADNHAWRGGRMVTNGGYILLCQKPRKIWEHREVLAEKLGRPLEDEEVTDHIDGITIHNDPANLRVFSRNGEHLRETISGRKKQISVSGRQNISAQKKGLVGTVLAPVDTYRLRKERGDVRLHAILRAALELGKEHPCLSGTTHWLEQAGIDPNSDRSLQRGWDALTRRYEQDLAR